MRCKTSVGMANLYTLTSFPHCRLWDELGSIPRSKWDIDSRCQTWVILLKIGEILCFHAEGCLGHLSPCHLGLKRYPVSQEKMGVGVGRRPFIFDFVKWVNLKESPCHLGLKRYPVSQEKMGVGVGRHPFIFDFVKLVNLIETGSLPFAIGKVEDFPKQRDGVMGVMGDGCVMVDGALCI
jgi:hypothetical protein